jgi:hypothetical protein
MERDPWLFSLFVCGRDPKAERHHRPLLYVYTRRAALLAACLDNPAYDGPITAQVREDFRKHRIDWANPKHLKRMEARLRRVNVRMPRSSGKSTFADDGDLWDATVDPNITISIGSKSDPYAWARITTIGKFVMSPAYAYWFPDRVPDEPRRDITQDSIHLKGRTRIVPEGTIEGRGINSQWTGRHYRKNRRDDIVGTESGEASLSDALRHMANIDPIHDETGWVQDVYIGTINGDNDDHAMLADDPGVMSIVVPIEAHEGGTTLENIYQEGTLVLPEWFTRERVNEIKENAKKNAEHGPVYLLQNYYMAAHKQGASIFSRQMVERALFEWKYDDVLKRELIRRPVKGKEKIPRNQLKPNDWFYLDLTKLPRTAFAWAVDQSVAEDGSGDEWAFVLVVVDHEGVYYVLDDLADHGYNEMLAQIVPFDKKHGRPAYIGIDANATQGMTIEWLKRSEDFRDVARRVQPIRASNERKDVNIRNWIQGRMLSGEFWINPKLHQYQIELLKYRPYHTDGRRRRNPIDNRLDTTWMAMTMPRIPPSPVQMDEEEMEAEMIQMMDARRRDQQTGVLKESWFNRTSTNWRVA